MGVERIDKVKSTGPYHPDKVKTGAKTFNATKIIKISEPHNKKTIMTKIFDASIQDAKENQKQGATRNNAANQQANAAIMESLGGKTELSNREKAAAWYKKTSELVAFHCMGVSKEIFEEMKETTKGFTSVFTECSEESATKNGLTDTLTVGNHKFYIKNQEVNDAFDIIRSFESRLKVEKAKEVEKRVMLRAKVKEDALLVATAKYLGTTVEALQALRK